MLLNNIKSYQHNKLLLLIRKKFFKIPFHFRILLILLQILKHFYIMIRITIFTSK